jgi:hypothetical protein
MNVTVSFPVPADRLKVECDRLSSEISTRKSEIEILRSMLAMVRKGCTHPGQQTGYNDRDGSWANACPICGESH